MKIIHTIEETRAELKRARAAGKSIGFVPTMGYLHRGHTSLVDISAQHTDYQVMSLFVNRIQFNDPEDFKNYPKDFETDAAAAERAGIDLLFAPDDSEMYNNALTKIDVDILTKNLCGAHRPGHFQGVFTVVSKLFNIIQPDVAVFGQKDVQQAVSLEKMVYDLNFPIRMIIAPTVREDDGLAMSSRNKRLIPEARVNALVIYRSLKKAEEMISAGERGARLITSEIKSIIESGLPDSIDYITVVRYSDLAETEILNGKIVIAVAAFFAGIRLIDNMIINFEGDKPVCAY